LQHDISSGSALILGTIVRRWTCDQKVVSSTRSRVAMK